MDTQHLQMEDRSILFTVPKPKNSFVSATIFSVKLHSVKPYPAEMLLLWSALLNSYPSYSYFLSVPAFLLYCSLMCQTDWLCIMQKGSLLFLTLLSSCNQFLCHPSKYFPAILEHFQSVCVSGVWNSLLLTSLWLHAFIWNSFAIAWDGDDCDLKESKNTNLSP